MKLTRMNLGKKTTQQQYEAGFSLERLDLSFITHGYTFHQVRTVGYWRVS